MEGSSKKFFCPTNPHFIKPMLPGFQSKLSIPNSFLKNLEEEIKEVDAKYAILRNNKVDDFWTVKVGFEDGLHFKDGWEKFCKDHGLEVGDLLVFRHHKNLVFDVFIFDHSVCERPFPGSHHSSAELLKKRESSGLINNNPAKKELCKKMKGIKRPIKDNKMKACSEAKVNFEPRGHPFCHAVVNRYCLKWSGMIMPMKFVRENDLASKCEVTLIDQKGEEYRLPLRKLKQGTYVRVYIGKWREFRIKNGLKVGDPVVFELIASGDCPKLQFYK